VLQDSSVSLHEVYNWSSVWDLDVSFTREGSLAALMPSKCLVDHQKMQQRELNTLPPVIFIIPYPHPVY